MDTTIRCEVRRNGVLIGIVFDDINGYEAMPNPFISDIGHAMIDTLGEAVQDIEDIFEQSGWAGREHLLPRLGPY